MKHTRMTLLVLTAAIVPGGMLLLLPSVYRKLSGRWKRWQVSDPVA